VIVGAGSRGFTVRALDRRLAATAELTFVDRHDHTGYSALRAEVLGGRARPAARRSSGSGQRSPKPRTVYCRRRVHGVGASRARQGVVPRSAPAASPAGAGVDSLDVLEAGPSMLTEFPEVLVR
jgi:hypothetical protein